LGTQAAGEGRSDFFKYFNMIDAYPIPAGMACLELQKPCPWIDRGDGKPRRLIMFTHSATTWIIE